MTKVETAKILAVIQEFWPRFLDGRDVEHVVNAWLPFFAEDSYETVDAALKAFIATDTKGFFPSIGQIKEMMRKMGSEDDSETQAWALVQKAVSNSLYHSQEEFQKLPFAVQKCVGSPKTLRAWAEMDEETFLSVVASNFMKSYRSRIEWMRDYEKLPDNVKKLCAITSEMMKLPGEVEMLPPARASREEDNECACGVPTHVLEQVNAIRKRMEQEEKKKAAETAKRMVQRLLGNDMGGKGGEGT